MSDLINIPIAGFHKQSFIDFPGNISSVIFTYGCNINCRYCHNSQLIDTSKIKNFEMLNQSELFDWLSFNSKLLDAVVVSGGEPTIHKHLPELISQIKNLGLKIKLDTNGSNPLMLKQLVDNQLVDYVAMDIKTALDFEKYKIVVGEDFSESTFKNIMQSIDLLKSQQKIEFEFRTTLDMSLQKIDFEQIAKTISGKYFIQKLRIAGRLVPQNLSDEDLSKIATSMMSQNRALTVAIR